MGAKRGQRVVRILLPVEWGGTTMVWPFTLNHHAAGERPWSVEVTCPNPERDWEHFRHFVYHAERDPMSPVTRGLFYPGDWADEADTFDEFLFDARTIQLVHSWMRARANKTYVIDQSDVYLARYVYKANWREVLASEAREKFLIDARERLERSGLWVPDAGEHEPCGVEAWGPGKDSQISTWCASGSRCTRCPPMPTNRTA